MAVVFNGSLTVTAGSKTYTAIPVSNVQGIGKKLKVELVMTGTAFPTGETTVIIGLSVDGGNSYREAGGIYTAPFPLDRQGTVPNQTLGFVVEDTTLVTHVRVKTIAPSAFSLPITINATELV